MNRTDKTFDSMQMSVEEMKRKVARDMSSRNMGALLWGENLFGDTSYPVLADSTGRNRNIKGLIILPEGTLYALTACPANKDISGVMEIATGDLSKSGLLNSSDMIADGGTPGQWSVLCDCYYSALVELSAQNVVDAPKPWW